MVSQFVRKVRTPSGVVAVQVVTRRGRQLEQVEHLGSAHTDAELALLLSAARERLSPGQVELDLSELASVPPRIGDVTDWTAARRSGQAALGDGGGNPDGCRRSGRRPVLARLLLLVIAAGTVLAACSGTSPQTGTALNPGYRTIFGTAPLRPGDQLGMLDVGLWNHSHQPLTITSITVSGRGVGSVIRIAEVKIAPDLPLSTAVTGGAYETDPPVEYIGLEYTGHCIRQVLRPVHGYKLAPGAKARVWVVIEYQHPGRFAIREHIIHYTQNGSRYQEAIPTGYTGSAAPDAKYLPPTSWQARCVKPMGARFLTNIK